MSHWEGVESGCQPYPATLVPPSSLSSRPDGRRTTHPRLARPSTTPRRPVAVTRSSTTPFPLPYKIPRKDTMGVRIVLNPTGSQTPSDPVGSKVLIPWGPQQIHFKPPGRYRPESREDSTGSPGPPRVGWPVPPSSNAFPTPIREGSSTGEGRGRRKPRVSRGLDR